MTLAFQLGLAYGLLAVLATAFLLLMVYWQYKKSEKPKWIINGYVFCRTDLIGKLWYIQGPDGSEIGPFKTSSEAEAYKRK